MKKNELKNGKKNSKKELNETNKKLLLIAIPVVVVLLVVGFVSVESFSGMMGNSVSENNDYQCEDSSYTKEGDKCTKQIQEKAYLIGDLNQDGEIDIRDVTVLQKSNTAKITLDDYQQILGDVNKDGSVDAIDTALLRRYIGNNSGSLGAINYINQKACRNDFTLKGDYCYGTITVDAVYVGNGSNTDSSVGNDNITDGSESKEAYFIGDVNKDGSVDILDVALLQKYIAGKVVLDEYQQILGDVNKDGAVDINDISILKKYVNSPQSGTTTASSYIYQRACLKDEVLNGTTCEKR